MALCWFGLLGGFAWSKLICSFNAEYRWAFLRLRFLAGVRADKTLDALSSRSAWFGRSLQPGNPSNSPFKVAFICPFVVLDPTYFGATIMLAPGQMPGNFLASPNADCLPFLVKLVRVYHGFITRKRLIDCLICA